MLIGKSGVQEGRRGRQIGDGDESLYGTQEVVVEQVQPSSQQPLLGGCVAVELGE